MSTMETTASSGTSDQSLLLAQIREAYGRVCYSHKTHETQADICWEKHRNQRRWKVALTAASSGAFLASLAGLVLDEQWAAVITSFIAVLLSASTLTDKTFHHGEDMQQHRESAAELWNLRESYLSLLVDLTSGSVSPEDARQRRDALQQAAATIYRDAPRTGPKAYRRAQQALQMAGDLTFSPSEIDQLLPEALRGQQGMPNVAGQ